MPGTKRFIVINFHNLHNHSLKSLLLPQFHRYGHWGREVKQLAQVEAFQGCTHSWKWAFCTSACSAEKGAGGEWVGSLILTGCSGPGSWPLAAWAQGYWFLSSWHFVRWVTLQRHRCTPASQSCFTPSIRTWDLTGVMPLAQWRFLYRNSWLKWRHCPLLHISQCGHSIYASVLFCF